MAEPTTVASSVRYGTTSIPYRVQRSARRRTVGLRVVAGQGVVVTAPPGVQVARLDRIVHTKAGWIVARLRELQAVAPTVPVREYVSGESYLYLGRHYRLKLQPAGCPLSVHLDRGLLIARGQGDVRQALVAWYRAHAEQRLAERVAQWHRRVGVPLPQVLVREQAKRWASCDDKGTLRFNWRIIQAPMRLVDYVVVHELVHLRHRDHYKKFWALLGRVMPDYEEWRRLLLVIGPGLSW